MVHVFSYVVIGVCGNFSSGTALILGEKMTREKYLDMLNMVRSNAGLFAFVKYGGKLLSLVSYVVYPLMLIWLFYRGHAQVISCPVDPGEAGGAVDAGGVTDVVGTGMLDFWAALIVPAVGFVLLSIYRAKVNAPRPYEVFDTPPLVPKNTRGNSFPSRHVFSAFIIATSAVQFFPVLGVILYICGVLLAVTRVLAGVHFPKDVIAGAAVGIGFGLIGFMIL